MSTPGILVFGAGGHGKVVADLARAAAFSVVGFVDHDPAKLGQPVVAGGGRVLYTDETLAAALVGGTIDGAIALAFGIGDNIARLGYADRWRAHPQPALVHPTAVIGTEVSIGDGSVVFANAVVNPGARLGRAIVVNSGAVVEHDCVIGDGAHVSPGTVLNGTVQVGALAWIGAQAVVLPGVRVGERAIVGAGAVVLKDVAPGTTVVGNPARPIRRER